MTTALASCEWQVMVVKPILIMGCQRSGTTLIGLVLGSHPTCLFIDEDEGATDCLEEFLKFEEGGEPVDVSRCAERASQKYCSPHKWSSGVLSQNVERLILKCINHVYEYHRILSILKDVKVLWIVRDVRDVICSMRKIDHPIEQKQVTRILGNPTIVNLYPTEMALLRTHEHVDHVRKAIIWKIKTSLMDHAKRISPHIYPLQYERMVNHSESTLREVVDFLGLPMSESMLNHHAMYRGAAIGNTSRTVPLNQKSVGVWRSELTEREHTEIWKYVGDYMEKLGYDQMGVENAY